MTSSKYLSELFLKESPNLRRYLHRFGADISSEDIAQESFARLWEADHGQIRSPRAFLFQTARNLARNALRSNRRAPIRAVAHPERLDTPLDAPSPEDAVDARDAHMRLASAVAALSPHHRDALLLFRVEGWSYREIGAHLGVSHRTVERYVADAIAQCHLALTESPQDL